MAPWYGGSSVRTPLLGIFNLIGSLCCASSWSDWPPLKSLSAEKIGLSLSHLVPEILGPKVALIFYQNVLFSIFLSILYQFSPWFSIQFNWPVFGWSFIFLTPHFSKTLDIIGSNILLYAEPGYRKFGEVSQSVTLALSATSPDGHYVKNLG